ncbi:MAG: homoserine dehydrogenase [Eubacteriales bacterium]|nr:homoserine dehydrogenase [Eubacteriales bacterium]
MAQERTIHAALLGIGTVGGGVYKLTQELGEDILAKTGARLVIDRILVRDRTKKREGVPAALLTDSWEEILRDEKIEIVIEVTGGIEPTLTRLTEALRAGKQVVTANKDLLAEYGAQLFEAAEEGHCDLHFEAAVAGAIPIIRPLRQSLAASQLTEVMGIVNGTTNYILTRMAEDGMGYGEALELATRLGYAESDPTSDVEGYDAGRKLAIMASIAFNSRVTFPQVYTEGITKITAEDIRYAREFGYVIKLIAMTRLARDGVEVKVHPMLLPEQHPLSSVRDSFNAVFVHGKACDDAMFMGRGAGQMPTASAVMGDVIDTMRNILHHSCGKIGCGCYKNLPVKPVEDTSSRFFLRIQVTDKPGALANIAGILGNNDVSIAQVVQKKSRDGVAELVIITDPVRERHFNDAIRILQGMSVLKEVSGIIRVYGS